MTKKLSCGIEFMRGILLILNILFVIVGLALIGIGIYIKVDNSFASFLSEIASESSFQGQSLGFLAYMMIGAGVITLLIALFGCIGALWHNRCLLYMYAIILIILMIVEFAGFIMAFVYKGKLKEVYEETLSVALQDGLQNNRAELLKAFQGLEDSMKCCGVHDKSDYALYPNVTLSASCMDRKNVTGCSEAIINFLNKNLPIIGGTLGGVILLELLGLIGAIALAVALKHAPDDSYSSKPGEVMRNLIPGRRR